MRILTCVCAASSIAALAAFAGDDPVVDAIVKVAPTVECVPLTIQGKEWCFMKVRFPDGSLYSHPIYKKDGQLYSAHKLLEGPHQVISQ